jgi:PTH1 family peptidyl-tRNA hydrolase
MVHLHVLRDFAKADAEWLDPLIAAIAENAPLLAEGKDNTYANRLHAAVEKAEKEQDEVSAKPVAKAGTVVKSKPSTESGGPLARGLKKLFGGKASGEPES